MYRSLFDLTFVEPQSFKYRDIELDPQRANYLLTRGCTIS